MKMKRNNYIIIHGSFASPFSNWIPWLRYELEKKNLEVYTPDFPSGVGFQTYENWSRLLKTYVDAKILTGETTIFAHSIAPVFIAKFLIENKADVNIEFYEINGIESYLVEGNKSREKRGKCVESGQNC